MYYSRLTNLCVILTFVFSHTVCDAAGWTVDAPHGGIFANTAGITGYGSGPANAPFIIGIYKDANGVFMAINTKLSGVSPEENWGDTINPPTATNYWWDPTDFGTQNAVFSIYAGSPATHRASSPIKILVEGGGV